MKKLYVTSTKQGDGKTMVTLGLMKAFSEQVKRMGFIKPLGLSERKVADYSIDHDASLMERVFSLRANIRDMNPVTLDRKSLDYFSDPARAEEVLKQIDASFARVSRDCDLVIIKGTMGASCGSVYGLSNASIAKRLGAGVVILTSGGIGHPLDEVALNIEYFRAHGVDILGVMFNKVLAQETDKLREFGTRFLEKQGTRLLGIIPYNRALSTCTVRAVAERIGGRVLAGEQYLGNHIGRFLVGALSAGSARKYFENNCLLITGGDRTDMLLAALVYALTGGQSGFKFAGIVLTGGVVPPEDILELLKRAEIPVVAVEQDSFTVTSAIGQMEPKISPADGQKIQTVCDVVRRHVDVKAIFELL